MSGLYTLELQSGADVIEALKTFVAGRNWQGAAVQGAFGSVVNVTVGNADGKNLPPQVRITEISGPFEFVGCTGEVIRKDEGYYTHLHVAGSLSDARVLGGGLQRATVFKGLKVYLQRLDL